MVSRNNDKPSTWFQYSDTQGGIRAWQHSTDADGVFEYRITVQTDYQSSITVKNDSNSETSCPVHYYN